MRSSDHPLRLLAPFARKQSATQRDSELHFRICWQIKAIVIFILTGCCLFELALAGILKQPSQSTPWYIPVAIMLGLAALPLCILLLLPGRVVIAPAGLYQRFWWRGEKYIPWSDVASVYRDSRDDSIIVYGKNQSSPITFSPVLVDQQRFERDLKNWAHHDSIPTDV